MKIKTPEEIEKLKQGGILLSQVLKEISDLVEPGISTAQLDKKAHQLITKAGARPSFKDYQGYPSTLCTSVNDQVVHALPGNYKLQSGDIIGLDCGLWYQGLCTDMALTLAVGQIKPETRRLLLATKDSLAVGLKKIKSKATTGDYGAAVQNFLEKQGFSVVRNLVGHGVGHAVHEEPRVPNFGQPGAGTVLQSGMVLALEPMATLGSEAISTADDGWSIKTIDGSLSAHFELTIVVTDQGFEFITPKIW